MNLCEKCIYNIFLTFSSRQVYNHFLLPRVVVKNSLQFFYHTKIWEMQISFYSGSVSQVGCIQGHLVVEIYICINFYVSFLIFSDRWRRLDQCHYQPSLPSWKYKQVFWIMSEIFSDLINDPLMPLLGSSL